MTVKKNIFWYNPSDCDIEISEGQDKVRINIPLSNVVNPKSLMMMLEKTANEEIIKNEAARNDGIRLWCDTPSEY